MNTQEKNELIALVQQYGEASRCGLGMAAQCTLKEIASRIAGIPADHPPQNDPPPPAAP